MKIEKTKEDKCHWKSIFKFRQSMNDFKISRKSSKYPKYNHEVWLSKQDAVKFAEFVRKCLKESEKRCRK